MRRCPLGEVDNSMLLFPWVPVRLARAALVVAAAAIMVLALISMPQMPMVPSWDKLNHWLAFFTLTLLADHAYPRQPFWRRLALWVLAYGVLIECIQWFTPNREADVLDILADGIGIVIYGALRSVLDLLLRRPAPAE
jgi:VanZ family protein